MCAMPRGLHSFGQPGEIPIKKAGQNSPCLDAQTLVQSVSLKILLAVAYQSNKTNSQKKHRGGFRNRSTGAVV